MYSNELKNINTHGTNAWIAKNEQLFIHLIFSLRKLLTEVTTTSLANNLNISYSQLYGYVNNTKIPRIEIAKKIVSNILSNDIYSKYLSSDTIEVFEAFLNDEKIGKVPLPDLKSKEKPNVDYNWKAYDNELHTMLVKILRILKKNFKGVSVYDKLYLTQQQFDRYISCAVKPQKSTLMRTIERIFDHDEYVRLLPAEIYDRFYLELNGHHPNDEIIPNDEESNNSYIHSNVKQKIRLRNIMFASKVLCNNDISQLRHIAGWLEMIGMEHPNIINLLELDLIPANKILGVDIDNNITESLLKDYPDCMVMCGDIKHILSMINYNFQVFNIDTCMSLYEGGDLDSILTEFSKTIPNLIKVHKKIVVFVTVCVSGTIRIDARNGNRTNDDKKRINKRLKNYFPNYIKSIEVEHYKNNGKANKMCQYRIEFGA